MRDLGRLRRSVADRHIAGVAGGLARHLDIDPIIVRVALVVLVFFGGSGLLLYAAGWLLVPEEGTADQPLGLDERSRRIALIGAGVLAALAALGDWAGAFWFPWPVVVVALLVLWFLNRNQRRAAPDRRPPRATAVTAQAYAGLPTYTGPDLHGLTTYDRPRPPTTPPPTSAPATPASAGPILFWATLALIAHRDRHPRASSTPPAPTCPTPATPPWRWPSPARCWSLGAFWGRAGGLILVGLIAALATLGGTASDDWEGTRLVLRARRTAGEVRDSYDIGTGELTLDLSGVTDVDGLDGRQRQRRRRRRARSRSSSRRGMDVTRRRLRRRRQRRRPRPGDAAASTSSRTASSTAATRCPT